MMHSETDPILKSVKHASEKSSFDLVFLRRLFRIGRRLCNVWQVNKWMLALLIVSVSNLYVVSFTGQVTGGFYSVMEAKDSAAFKTLLWKGAVIITTSAVLDSTVKFIGMMLSWHWRRRLTSQLQTQYLSNRAFYNILSFDNRIDNPDQRIHVDVDSFTTALSQIVSGAITSPLTIAYYTLLTWRDIGWYAPLTVTGYFLISYVLNKLIMGPIVHRIFRQEKLEGNFRFAHARIRTNAESIALFAGEEVERQNVESKLDVLLNNRLKLNYWDYLLSVSNNVFTYCGSLVNYTVIALPILNGWLVGDTSAAFVANASFLCIQLISVRVASATGLPMRCCASQLTDVFAALSIFFVGIAAPQGFSKFNNLTKDISDMAGYASRVGQMLEVIEKLKQFDDETCSGKMEVVPPNDTTLSFNSVSVYSPTKELLLRKLTFAIPTGQSLLITGPSGCGKTSIFRVVSGLWPFFEGEVRKPSLSTLFIPQTPYVTSGTLIDQIVFPLRYSFNGNVDISQDEVRQILKVVELENLLKDSSVEDLAQFDFGDETRLTFRSRSNREWIETLSPGEQQRLSMARVLFHKPQLAFLDEVSSSVSTSVETKFYNACKEKGITVVSIGHRESLRRHHDFELALNHHFKWHLRKLDTTVATDDQCNS